MFGRGKSETQKNHSQSILFKYLPCGQVEVCREKQEAKYFRLPKCNSEGGNLS